MSLNEIYFRNNLFFVGTTINAGSEIGGFVADNLLEKSLDIDKFWRWTPNSYVALTFPTAADIDVCIVERRHTLVAGNIVKVYLSNTGTDPGDADEIETHTVLASEEGRAIVIPMLGDPYLFARVEFTGSNPDLSYQEIGWLFLGAKDELDQGYNNKVVVNRPHVAVTETTWLENQWNQKRSDQFWEFNGSMIKVPDDELEDLWQPLSEYAVNSWPFLFLYDNRTALDIAISCRLMQWIDVKNWNFIANIRGATKAEDFYNFSLILKEVASAGASPAS